MLGDGISESVGSDRTLALPVRQACTDNMDKTGNKRPPPKRVITDARREQNRAAQRLYRQRRKEHNQRIKDEKKRNANVRRELRPKPTEQTPDVDTSSSPSPSLSDSDQAGSTALDSPGPLFEPFIPVIQPFPSVGAAATGPEDSLGILDDVLATIPSAPSGQGTDTSLEHEDSLISTKGLHPSLVPASRAGAAMSPRADNSAYQRNRKSPSLACTFADPWANTVEFIQTTIFSAILQNALCLGFDLSKLAACSFNQGSPFYRPDVTPQDDPAKLFNLYCDSLPRSSDIESITIPPNLRPTLTQFLVPHHISFDLIPIPLLRDRAIMLSATMPHAFNVGEIKLDIYQHGGLVVWKQSDKGECQPWEMRSWEAAPWFLKKWSMAVDGDGGELSRQSSRWQSLRKSQMRWLELLLEEQPLQNV